MREVAPVPRIPPLPPSGPGGSREDSSFFEGRRSHDLASLGSRGKPSVSCARRCVSVRPSIACAPACRSFHCLRPCVSVEYAYSDNSLDPDDEDSDYHQESYKESYKDRRRRAHTQAEQKRRDAIKRGYDDLQTIVPTCQQQDFSIGSQKLSKAIVLQKSMAGRALEGLEQWSYEQASLRPTFGLALLGGSIDYIQFLHKEKKKQEEEVSTLRKDVMALKIMKVNYEQIVKAHQDNPHEGEDQVSDQVKFNVFQGIMDALFQSFNASISMASFQELSACVFSWIEEHCKPQTLREIVIGVLHQLKNQLY
ncbi:Max-like protein X [Myotis brandtii]|uniref:Max-like protein X n=1 Tax=Myotis brandtii TaxID=109478 RepID=S7NBA9_MYOBR|nr:Max-like protein X [Myotis brandtii]